MFGWTPLLAAVHANHLRIVKELLAHKHVDVDKAEDDSWAGIWSPPEFHLVAIGNTPLNIASDRGYHEIAGALLACEGVRVNEVTGTARQTPLHWAVEEDNIEAVQALLAHKGVRVNMGRDKGRQGGTPLDTAEDARPHGNSDEIAGILRAAGAKTRKQIAEEAEEAGAQRTALRDGVQPPFVGAARMAGVIERAEHEVGEARAAEEARAAAEARAREKAAGEVGATEAAKCFAR